MAAPTVSFADEANKKNQVNTNTPSTASQLLEVAAGNALLNATSATTNELPVIHAVDRVISKGSNYDPMEGVTATDKEDGDITSKVLNNGYLVDTNEVGKYSVIYEVTDSGGRSTQKFISVTVKEGSVNNALPVIHAQDKTIDLASKFDPMEGITATDAEDGDLTAKITYDNKVDTSAAGLYSVIYRVTDSEGQSVEKVINITVKWKPSGIFDNAAPVINATDKTIDQGSFFYPMTGVTATDAEDGDLTAKVTFNSKVDTSTAGQYLVTYQVTDSKGSTTTKVITVTVRQVSSTDNKPVIIGATDKTITVGDSFNPTAGVTAFDSEDGDLTSKVVVYNGVNTNKVGVYPVEYSVKDSKGNVAMASIKVTVKAGVVDNEAPVIHAVDRTVDKGSQFNPMEGVTATDKEDGDLTKKITYDSKVNINKLGQYQVTYQVADSAGKTAKKVINITVKEKIPGYLENTAPVIHATDRTIDQGSKFDPMEGVTATDKEDGNLTSQIVNDGSVVVDTNTAGDYRVMYYVEDANGVRTIKMVTITVKKSSTNTTNNKPVITGAADKTITVGDVFDPKLGVTAFDTEDGDLTNKLFIYSDVNTNKIGVYPIEYSVRDSNGNVTVASIKVTVKAKTGVDNSAPVITATDKTIDQGSKFNPLAGVTATDKEDGDLTSNVTYDGFVNTNAPGDYRITYQVKDSKGLVAKKVITVTVRKVSNDKPVIKGAVDQTINVGDAFDAKAGVTAFDTEDGDLTNKLVITSKVNTNTPGMYAVDYRVTDSIGNTTTKTIIVSVLIKAPGIFDNTAPKLTAENKTVNQGSYFDPMAGVTAYDKEDGDLTSKITHSGFVSTAQPGQYFLTYTVEDSVGLSSSKYIVITVKKTTNDQPIIRNAVNKTITVGDAFNPKDGIFVFDAEDGDLTGKLVVTGKVDTNKAGTYPLEYSVTDSQGAKVTANITVTVKAKQLDNDVAIVANNFTIGKDTAVTGKVGSKITRVTVSVNNETLRMVVPKDGEFKVDILNKIDSTTDKVKIIGYNDNAIQLATEMVKVVGA